MFISSRHNSLEPARLWTLLAALGCVSAFAACGGGAKAAVPKTLSEGIYTDAQAVRGEQVYSEHCVQCHAEDLSGDTPYNPSPSLAGKAFRLRWDKKTMGDLFLQARTQMPKDKPGSLKSNEYADVVSFILKANEFPAGKTELNDDVGALTQVKIITEPTALAH